MKQSILKSFSVSKHIPRHGKPSAIPGTVKYVGKVRNEPVKLHILDYNATDFTEKDVETISESLQFKEKPTVTWLNVTGVHDETIIHDIGEKFEIHPLVLEDIANTTQRPKMEDHDNYLFVIIKMGYFNEALKEISLEQVSLLIGKDFVISLQEKEGDILDSLRERIRTGKGKIRRMGSDYLMYSIIDTIVDNYFFILENVGEQIEGIEAGLMRSADQNLLGRVYHLRHELAYLRRSIWPMREVVSTLQRIVNKLVHHDTFVYLRDVYDHTVQLVETLETFREMSSGMLELYQSTVSNKMNEVMKVLTIFAAIFIPLTFAAGVYGMNFEFMPELKWKLAYPVWWIAIIIVTLAMLWYFKKKRWL
jgi:magnesium transporter